MKNVRTFADLKSSLNKRASAAQAASQKKANESGGVPAVPETDDRSKGTVAIPKDPDGAPMKATGLENKTNAEVTGSFAPTPSKTITGEEKPASLAGRAQKIAAGVRDLAAQLSKKAEAGTDGGKSVTPNMPPNTQCNDGTTEGGKPKPPAGGTFSGTNNPDANAKTSGAAASAKTAGSSMAAEGTDKEKKVSLPAGDSKGNIPDSKNNANETKGNGQAAVQSKGEAQDDSKMAATDDFQIDASYHLKLASLILSTEEGRMFAQRQIEKAHGAEAAADIVKAASIMEQRAIEIAEMEASGAAEAEAMWKSASVEDRAKIVKLASVHSKGRAQFETELEKQAYDAGAMAAAQMGDAGMLGGAPGGAAAGTGADAGAAGAPAGLDPAAAGGMGGAEAAGAMGGGGGEELSPDAVVAALDQMVSSGELQPEQAAEILQAILGGGAGAGGGAEAGGAPGGMPPGGMPPGAAGGMPPGAAGGEAPPADKGGAEKKEPAGEKKESPKEESDEEKEAALLKRAHDLARSAIIPAKK